MTSEDEWDAIQNVGTYLGECDICQTPFEYEGEEEICSQCHRTICVECLDDPVDLTPICKRCGNPETTKKIGTFRKFFRKVCAILSARG